MAANINWMPFTAFNGTLTAAMLQHTVTAPAVPPNPPSIAELNTDKDTFYNWLNALRAAPGNHGIPATYIQDVQTAVDTFFPMPAGGVRRVPLRVRLANPYVAGGPAPGVPVLAPITVHLGPTVRPAAAPFNFPIADSAGALAYIFSVVQPSVVNPTWNTYYLPLLVLFSRCLYLAHITWPAGAVNQGDAIISDVPLMACVMYDTTAGLNPIPIVFGSTCTYAPKDGAADPNLDAHRIQMTAATDAWRRANILNSALAHRMFPPGAVAPPIPADEPTYLQSLADALYQDFHGRITRNAVIDEGTVDAVAQPIANAWRAWALAQAPAINCARLKLNMVFDSRRLRPTLRALLVTILRFRRDPAFNPAALTPAFLTAVEAFLRFYVMPQMCIVTGGVDPNFRVDANRGVDVPAAASGIPQLMTTAMNGTPGGAPGIIAAHRQNFITRLDLFHADILNNTINIENQTPYGRCAETYPFHMMQRHIFPACTPANVRGISLELRKIGQSMEFQGVFDSNGVDRSDQNRGPYRYPCDNCKSLVPVYGMVPGAANYDLDLLAAPHNPARPPY